MKIANKKIVVTGGAGFLGQNIVQHLIKMGADENDITVPRSRDSDLRIWENCARVVRGKDIVIHGAGKGGGIGFNRRYPGSILFDNVMMGTQLMEASRKEGVSKFVTIGTVCEYPKDCPVPFREDDLWNGYPEPTNASYGMSKKILLTQGQAYRQEFSFPSIHLLVVNLYGPGDNFDLNDAHVIPALIGKIHRAKVHDEPVTLWGTGNPSREFLFVGDAAAGICLAADSYDKAEPVNIGSGEEIRIRDLASMIAENLDYRGRIEWDETKPDGQPRRKLDVGRASREFGFKAKVTLKRGLQETIEWYLKNHSEL